ncbi:MAG: CPBP family intramembrane metalloprotease [Planctomycetota bacterium]|nr:MAG: CPBP family intramembrane metalloprotease [Planctomycetota bacterium]
MKNLDDDRRLLGTRLFLIGVLFELGAGIAALIAGWVIGWDVLATLRWSSSGILHGAAATVPMIGFLVISVHLPWRVFVELRETVEEVLVPPFRKMSIAQLAILATAAGWGEELLFRGLLQGFVTDRWEGITGTVMGIVVANLLFACAHPVSKTYMAVTGGLGVYLSLLWLWSGDLAAPITAHAAYDLLALLYLLRISRRSTPEHGSETADRPVSVSDGDA